MYLINGAASSAIRDKEYFEADLQAHLNRYPIRRQRCSLAARHWHIDEHSEFNGP